MPGLRADGATLAVGQQDGRISLWDAATGHNRSTLDGHTAFVASFSFAPDGATLASSGGDRSVRIWDLPTGRQRAAIVSPTSTFVAMTFSPDGRLLVLGDQVSPVVWLWKTSFTAEPDVLSSPSGAVVAVAISPDGTTLAAADYEGLVTFWDLATKKVRPKRLRHAGVRSLAFAPGGRLLATGGFDGTIHLWDFPILARNRRSAPPPGPANPWPRPHRDNFPKFSAAVSALWQGLPTLPPSRPEVSEPSLRPETPSGRRRRPFGCPETRAERQAKSGKLFPSHSSGRQTEDTVDRLRLRA